MSGTYTRWSEIYSMQIATRNGGPGAINTIARVGDINLYDSVPGRCFRALRPKAFMVQFVPWS